MPTSAICGNNPPPPHPESRRNLSNTGGFTLLELIVVLLLVGLVTALAMPNLSQLYTSVTRTAERDYILDQFAGMGQQALLSGQGFVVLGTIGATEARLSQQVSNRDGQVYELDVPEGWQVRLQEPLIVRGNGVCLGGELTLIRAGKLAYQISLDPPYCTVRGNVRGDVRS